MRRKYRDSKAVEDETYFPVVHGISKMDDPRRHDPKHPGGAASGVKLSLMTEFASGDWSWRPAQDKAQGDDFCSFRGVALAPSEARQRGAEPGACFYGPHDESTEDFQERARAAHIAAGDPERVRGASHAGV